MAPSNLDNVLGQKSPAYMYTCIFNPWRAYAAIDRGLQYSVCLSVYLSVTTLQASVMDRMLKFRHKRSADDTLECFDSWILLTMLASRDMVRQEAYEQASLPETSAHVIKHSL